MDFPYIITFNKAFNEPNFCFQINNAHTWIVWSPSLHLYYIRCLPGNDKKFSPSGVIWKKDQQLTDLILWLREN